MVAGLSPVRYCRADRGALMHTPQLFTVDTAGVTQIADADAAVDDLDLQPSIETAGTA